MIQLSSSLCTHKQERIIQFDNSPSLYYYLHGEFLSSTQTSRSQFNFIHDLLRRKVLQLLFPIKPLLYRSRISTTKRQSCAQNLVLTLARFSTFNKVLQPGYLSQSQASKKPWKKRTKGPLSSTNACEQLNPPGGRFGLSNRRRVLSL